MTHWPVVWITGASTGIGRAVALALAAGGSKVAVSARSADKLADLAAAHANVTAFPLDVTDGAATAAVIAAIETRLGPIDLAILNAGTWDPMGAKDFNADRVAASMAVNFVGVARGIEHMSRLFMQRRRGHLALVASVAGYRGMPMAAAYAPSKAALINLAEVLKSDLERFGVATTVINPGFVETPMTAVNKFPMPFMVSVDDAARRIIAGLARKKFEIAFPWQLVALLKVMRVLPYPLYFWVARNLLTPKSPPK